MSEDALKQWANKYLKKPDCFRSLLWLGGGILVSKYLIDRQVQDYIFGPDGKGGEILACYSRINHHQEEYQEHRKRWYWHQRKADFYRPYDYGFNDKEKDYQKLSYNNAHRNKYFDPEKQGHKGHDPETYEFNELSLEDYYSR